MTNDGAKALLVRWAIYWFVYPLVFGLIGLVVGLSLPARGLTPPGSGMPAGWVETLVAAGCGVALGALAALVHSVAAYRRYAG